jgi:serine protease Do
MSLLNELPAAISSVTAAVSPAIVSIGRRHRGSGFVIAPGRVVTNAHNIRGEEVTVTFADGRTTRGRVAGADIDGDLAVVEVETGEVPPLAWAPEASLAAGAVVFGVGATPGGGARVTFGIVSAISRAFRGPGGRRIAGSVEHTAPLAAGSSGGPITDAVGRVLGINTNRLGEGFYLARPADSSLQERVGELARGVTTTRRRLGVAIAPAHVARRLRRSVGLPDREGLLVRGVEDGSPAETSGIAQGDLIVAIDGVPVIDPDDLVEAIARSGSSYRVGLVRGAEELEVTVADEA